jgi:hypothetical protein
MTAHFGAVVLPQHFQNSARSSWHLLKTKYQRNLNAAIQQKSDKPAQQYVEIKQYKGNSPRQVLVNL